MNNTCALPSAIAYQFVYDELSIDCAKYTIFVYISLTIVRFDGIDDEKKKKCIPWTFSEFEWEFIYRYFTIAWDDHKQKTIAIEDIQRKKKE